MSQKEMLGQTTTKAKLKNPIELLKNITVMLEVSVKVKWEQRKIHDLNNTETMYWKPQSLRLRSWWLNTKRAHSCPTSVQPSRRKGKNVRLKKILDERIAEIQPSAKMHSD